MKMKISAKKLKDNLMVLSAYLSNEALDNLDEKKKAAINELKEWCLEKANAISTKIFKDGLKSDGKKKFKYKFVMKKVAGKRN